MTFNRVLQLVLAFFNMAKKYADKAASSAAKECECHAYMENGTLFIGTCGTTDNE